MRSDGRSWLRISIACTAGRRSRRRTTKRRSRSPDNSKMEKPAASMPPAVIRLLFQRRYQLIDDRVGLVAHLVVSRILNRMRHEDAIEFRESQRGGLLFGRIAERTRGHHHRGLAVEFKPY